MLDRKKPIWNSGLLHLALIAGAVVFALPYAWLVGTSFKLDKEVRSAEIRIFPQRPIPVQASPYIDRRQFAELARPESVADDAWTGWMKAFLVDRIGAVVDDWQDAKASGLPADTMRSELIEGVFRRLVNLIPHDALAGGDRTSFSDAIDRLLTAEIVQDCFSQAYRYFGLGTVRLQTKDYRVFDLIGDTPVGAAWASEGRTVRLDVGREPGHAFVVGHYDLGEAGAFEVAGQFEADVDLANPDSGFKRLELSFHSDQTWHEMRVLVEMDGKRYRSSEPKYLGDDQWSEIQLQLPGPEDERLVPKRYILLEEIDAGSQYDHGPGKMKVVVRVERSGQLEAYWAKCTENYRRAFDEVPFWRYFKTSLFLVAANIAGTLLSCSLAAYAFARLNWPGRDLCFVLVLATLMIPPQVTMIPSFVIYKYLGWYNTLAPLWVPNCLALNGFAIFLLRQAMKGIPRDLEEAAKIDGCSQLRIYWSVVLPLVKPTLAAISIFTFMFVWNDFMAPLIYVNDQRLYPLSLGLFSFMAGRENQFTLIMAGSMIMTLPVIVTFFLAQRSFIQGVTMSGIKS